MRKPKVLVVEDEEDILELIHFHLFKEQYEIFLARDGEEALSMAKKERPDLVLLDLMIPKIHGLEVCQKLKSDPETKGISIIMVTAKSEESDIIKGLELGAEDYIIKPFAPKVLIARVKALLRRSESRAQNKKGDVIKIHNITLDNSKRKVFIDGTELSLTFSEFQILFLMASHPGRVYARSQIVDIVRGENHAITDRSVDVQIVGLRKKMGVSGDLVETVRGVGYRFKEESSAT
ncbi:MAG: DNA-binding response regulator [Bdellovibrionales bacterium GWA2_49_15]|nr:MAG: DNA-binding response regulator [Bdellovibrionales bacterium GWA2_49_15]HAZ13943.1 DNA-binding response regulator [Bdellovibrionales bacterium]